MSPTGFFLDAIFAAAFLRIAVHDAIGMAASYPSPFLPATHPISCPKNPVAPKMAGKEAPIICANGFLRDCAITIFVTLCVCECVCAKFSLPFSVSDPLRLVEQEAWARALARLEWIITKCAIWRTVATKIMPKILKISTRRGSCASGGQDVCAISLTVFTNV